jgi:hypothetical protein
LHHVFVFKQLDGNFFLEFFLMKYRGMEYAVIQEVDRDTWRWTVDLIDGTAESGRRQTREGALTAIVLTVDRWIRNTNPVPVALPAQRARQQR